MTSSVIPRTSLFTNSPLLMCSGQPASSLLQTRANETILLAFFGLFNKKISKIWLCNVISQERINKNTKFYIPICRKFQAITRKCQIFFIIFTVSGVTAVRSDNGVMSDIPDKGLRNNTILTFNLFRRYTSTTLNKQNRKIDKKNKINNNNNKKE